MKINTCSSRRKGLTLLATLIFVAILLIVTIAGIIVLVKVVKKWLDRKPPPDPGQTALVVPYQPGQQWTNVDGVQVLEGPAEEPSANPPVEFGTVSIEGFTTLTDGRKAPILSFTTPTVYSMLVDVTIERAALTNLGSWESVFTQRIDASGWEFDVTNTIEMHVDITAPESGAFYRARYDAAPTPP